MELLTCNVCNGLIRCPPLKLFGLHFFDHKRRNVSFTEINDLPCAFSTLEPFSSSVSSLGY